MLQCFLLSMCLTAGGVAPIGLAATIHSWRASEPSGGSLPENQKDLDSVKAILADQVSAWNRGDLEGFMNGYLPSDDLVFIGKRGLTHGWRQTLENYRTSYPDRATMGRLTFDILHMETLGGEHIFVIGKWRLDRDEKEDAEGHFSLIWKKINGRWLIIADHSS